MLNNGHVLTVEGEYKIFEADLADEVDCGDADTFCLFDGNAWFLTGAWLFPQQVGIGQFQPYARYTSNEPDFDAEDSDLIEVGLNYVIKGHNALVNVNYTDGDAWLVGVPKDDVSTFTVGVQVQI